MRVNDAALSCVNSLWRLYSCLSPRECLDKLQQTLFGQRARDDVLKFCACTRALPVHLSYWTVKGSVTSRFRSLIICTLIVTVSKVQPQKSKKEILLGTYCPSKKQDGCQTCPDSEVSYAQLVL